MASWHHAKQITHYIVDRSCFVLSRNYTLVSLASLGMRTTTSVIGSVLILKIHHILQIQYNDWILITVVVRGDSRKNNSIIKDVNKLKQFIDKDKEVIHDCYIFKENKKRLITA